MRRPRSDVDALVAATLALAGAFVSFAILQFIAVSVSGTSIGPLAPRETLGRLWVFFVLAPVVIAVVGVGIPCALRTVFAVVRGELGRDDAVTLAVVASSGLLVITEASMQRSGAVSLFVLCVVCLWRLRRRMSSLADWLRAPLLAVTGLALLGFAIYQHRALVGEPLSVAVAPTLFLLAFYSTTIGVATGAMSGRRGAYAGGAWLAVFAGWIIGAERWPLAAAAAASLVLGLLAARARGLRKRHVDERRSLL